MNRLRTYLSFVRFSHSVFALPFALTGALLAVPALVSLRAADAEFTLLRELDVLERRYGGRLGVAILDGNKGTLRLNASSEDVARIRQTQARAERRRQENLAHALEPAVTAAGTRIEVFANIGGLKDATQIAALGGEGVGLLRSEFLFMERVDAPTEEEQFERALPESESA